MSLQNSTPPFADPSTPDRRPTSSHRSVSTSAIKQKLTTPSPNGKSNNNTPSIRLNSHLDVSSLPSDDLSDTETTWSSAIGKASVAGKSGRVIERLQNDVDRLRRELALATATVEEEQRRSESARSALDSLRGRAENLEAICETNRTALARRDRKIEELRTDLDAERLKNKDIGSQNRNMALELGSIKAEHETKLQRERERADRKEAEYEALRDALRRVESEYGRRATKLRTDIDALKIERREDQLRLSRLDGVCETLRTEMGRMEKENERVRDGFAEYRDAQDDAVRDIRRRAWEKDRAGDALLKEAKAAVGEMRWVVGVKKQVKGAG